MYDEAFDTEWERLTEDEAVRRMFALGAAAALGDDHPEERARIRALASTTYERSLLDLAYDEGHARATGLRATEGGNAREAWDELVAETENEPVRPSARPPRAVERLPTGITQAVARAEFLELSADDLSRFELPEMLRRKRVD